MKSVNPKISVVIPAYNEEKFIEVCLESLRNQILDKELYEVIVVDNNSTDDTAILAKKAGAIVVFEEKRGVCSARHAGTLQARGEIIVSTDADTVFAKDWLQKIYREFENPELVALAGSCKFVNAPWWGKYYATILFGSVHKVYKRTGKVKYLAASNAAFRKSAWRGYNVHLAQGGDELELLKDLQSVGKVKYLPYNDVHTSSRRLHKGLFYNLFVTGFLYYLTDYFVARKLGKTVLGSYKPIREDRPRSVLNSLVRTLVVFSVFVTAYAASSHRAQAAKLIRHTGTRFESMEDRADLRIKELEVK